MKAVWIVIAVLVAAALVIWLQPPRNARVDPDVTAEIERVVEDSVESTLAATPRPAPAPATAPTPSGPASDAQDLVADLATERAHAVGAEAPALAPTSGATPVEIRLGLDRPIKNATVIAGHFARTPEGDLLADDRWRIAGAGTEDDPYRISWDLLTSAMESYQPRIGTNSMPQRIAMLDGAHVAIEGYFAFPIIATEVKQGLVTQNRWDGCCIGIPPTAYDAIEMSLSAPRSIERSQHQIMFGEARGVLRVDPYLLDGWLVGLYLLDNASIRFEL